LVLPLDTCTFEEFMSALAAAEPRIAGYLRRVDGTSVSPFRPLLQDQPLEPGSPIPDGAVVTLLYAIAGGSAGNGRHVPGSPPVAMQMP
jgi:hypothetical protein